MALPLVHRRTDTGVVASILVADPSAEAVSGVTVPLRSRGVSTTSCRDGAHALFQIGRLQPDLVLAAAQLPVVGIGTLLRVVREYASTPVVVGAEEGEVAAVGRALRAGATACIARPYRLSELLPLLRAVRPEATAPDEDVLELGEVRLDPVSHDVQVRRCPVYLRLREFELLAYLMRNSHRVVPPRQIQQAIWGTNGGDTNTVAVHIRRLRVKLGDDPRDPRMIHTIRGVGYRFAVEESG